jgi:hypothetical protein
MNCSSAKSGANWRDHKPVGAAGAAFLACRPALAPYASARRRLATRPPSGLRTWSGTASVPTCTRPPAAPWRGKNPEKVGIGVSRRRLGRSLARGHHSIQPGPIPARGKHDPSARWPSPLGDIARNSGRCLCHGQGGSENLLGRRGSGQARDGWGFWYQRCRQRRHRPASQFARFVGGACGCSRHRGQRQLAGATGRRRIGTTPRPVLRRRFDQLWCRPGRRDTRLCGSRRRRTPLRRLWHDLFPGNGLQRGRLHLPSRIVRLRRRVREPRERCAPLRQLHHRLFRRRALFPVALCSEL